MAVAVDGTVCTGLTGTSVAFAVNASGHLLACLGGVWNQGSRGKPQASLDALQALPASALVVGQTRVATDTMLPYTWDGTKWVASAIDKNGALNLRTTVAANTACGLDTTGAAQPDNAVQLGVTTTGEVLTCQNGVWTSSASIVLNISDIGCMYIIGAASTPYDYPSCNAPFGTNSWDVTSQTTNNVVYRTVSSRVTH